MDSNFPVWLVIVAGLLAVYRAYRIYYNLYLHPLSKLPGPKLYAVSWIPRLWRQHVSGCHHRDLVKLHEKYGAIVRVGPDEVSAPSGAAWEVIGGKSRQFLRDPNFFKVSQLQQEGKSFISLDKAEHHAIRRMLLPAFTNKAFQQHEEHVASWVTKLVSKIRANESPKEINIERLFTWFTFDVMGALSFGTDFGCLSLERDHTYLRAAELGSPFLSIMQIILRFPRTRWLYNLALRLPWAKLWSSLRTISDAEAKRWIEDVADVNREDIMAAVYKGMHDEKDPVTPLQALDVASILTLSGAEATPILMTAMMWNILKTPRVWKRLCYEIRESGLFQTAADLTAENTSKIPYLDAVIQESLRTDTPFATTIPRIVPPEGAWMDGYWLPGGTSCGVPHYCAGHWDFNFSDPEEFVPERWLPEERDEKYAYDKRDAFRPFAKGSLDCIGKRFVYNEVHMAFATLIWYFDLSLASRSLDWDKGHRAEFIRIIRQKRPLYIKATPRQF
ncbi:putative averantin oxidoreductase [Colletotrichum sublineola]|uniref:Putative averantin oxidoreductase n=1 Tax=Colletotrichum sublineola TaxID=1173701 RepID=A0A066XEC3_COLSU|nr:putative averantin oxidoreductase [Colletotrichum sublineola]